MWNRDPGITDFHPGILKSFYKMDSWYNDFFLE